MDRLVFAPKRPNPEHLARYQLADLFLDTSPYGAHTTAADALWMGVPILTVPGFSFASRVCADVLRAGGLPDLICSTSGELEARAVRLAQHPAEAAALRRRVEQQRKTSLLFNTDVLARSIEDLFGTMWTAFSTGTLPSPSLHNLDEYFDVGLDLHSHQAPQLTRDALLHAYRVRLGDRDKLYPLQPDERLWTKPKVLCGGDA